MEDLTILLTNDDGIDAIGLGALYDRLNERWDVTAVAPVDDRSGAGLTMNTSIKVEPHERGFAVEGTPADCVEVALGGLDVHPDLVISGCNPGPNIGAHTLGRSGTVGAAIEAGFAGTPAIAVSLYDATRPVLWPPDDISTDSYGLAVEVTEYLVERTMSSDVFAVTDYLNVTVPMSDSKNGDVRMRLTRPSESFEIYTPTNLHEALSESDGELTFRDRFWEGLLEGEVDDPVGTDRRAVADGEISVSPLRTLHEAQDTSTMQAITEQFRD
jgi:5'-nucleotidase